MATTYLNKTYLGAGDRTKWTLSVWLKRSKLGAENPIFSCIPSGSFETFCGFASDDTLVFKQKNDGGSTGEYVTTRKFRDVSGWYNFVFVYDKDNATPGDRGIIYVNGVRETAFNTESNFSDSSTWNGTNEMWIGRASASYFDGYMSHINFIDGTVYAASAFGETDSNGVWKIKTSPSVTYGTNGFLILKDGNTITDSSANTNNWTLGGGTLTDDKDNPSNVFATFNTIIKNHGATFTNGNTTYQAPSSNPVFGSLSTLGISSGKFYAECKYSAGSNHYLILGMADENFDANASTPDDLGKSGTTESIGYVVNTGAYRVNNSNTSWGIAGGDGDIIQMAIDKDNEKIFFGVNGTWGASSNPVTGSNGIDVSSVLTGDTWFFGVSNDTGASETIAQFNFGNGNFGTTAVSSAGTNASNNGVFEYDVPTGYTALCTKGLNGE